MNLLQFEGEFVVWRWCALGARCVALSAVLLLPACDTTEQDSVETAPAKSAELSRAELAKMSPEERRAAMRARRQGGVGAGEGFPGGLADRPIPVAVALAMRGDVDAFYATTATLTAVEEAIVVAKTQGVVESILVEEGDRVKEGQTLAQLDTERLRLELARTKASLENLKRNFERSERLHEQKMISNDLYDKARFDLESAQANYDLQHHELTEATLKAPLAGVISMRHIKVGNTLNPGNPAFDLTRTSELEAVLNVPEKELPKMAVGHPASIRVDAVPDKTFTGTVARIAPVVDAKSGTFRVVVSISNGDGRLKPGMFVRVETRYDRREASLLIPREAVVSRDGENVVFRVHDGKAHRTPVSTGYSSAGSIEVLDGLSAGDEVVVTGQNGLRDGANVRAVTL